MHRVVPSLAYLLLAAAVIVLSLAQVGLIGPEPAGEHPDPTENVSPEMEARISAMEKSLSAVDDRVDELSSQIWEFEREMQRNLHTLQTNILRRFSQLDVSSSSDSKPTDPRAVIEELRSQNIDLNLSGRFLRINGQLVVPRRPLECVAANDGGPLHEALLRTDAVPGGIRKALLALGAKPGRGADFQTGSRPTGTPLIIYIEWEGLKKPWRLEDVIFDSRSEDSMKHPTWVFSGSDYTTDFNSGKEFYIPDASHVAIALAHKFSDSAVISCDHPDAANENIWIPATPIFPKVEELNITLTICMVPIPRFERSGIKRRNPEEPK